MLPVPGTDPGRVDGRYLLSPWRDGWRCLVVIDERVRLRARGGRDLAPALPGIAAALAAQSARGRAAAGVSILDGVLAWPAAAAADRAPGVGSIEALELLDALCCDGRDVTRLDLPGRQAALRALRLREGDGLRLAPTWRGSATAALEQAERAGAAGASGLLARRSAAPYRPGRRSRDWLAFTAERLVELLLCGIAASGALVLGLPTSHGLAFGGVTWPTRLWRELAGRCREGPAPFPPPPVWGSLGPIAWARPELWVAVTPDERPGSGRGGPRWRFVRVQEDLSPPAPEAAA